jgi:sigma-B regulation protein RsbU (phosphoserine phosphatase)
MSIVRTLFQLSRWRYMDLSETLSLINSQLLEIIGPESDFVTCLACDIDFAGRTMAYINAGHCPGMLKSASGEITRMEPNASVLGFFPVDFPQKVMDLPDSSSLFLFTDGFYDWEVEPGRLLALEEFWDTAAGLLGRSDFLDQLMRALDAMSPEPCCFRDDLTALDVGMVMNGAREYVFVTQAKPDKARIAVKDVMGVMARYVQDDNALYEMDLCLTEACANVVKHAYPKGEPGDMEIRLTVDHGKSMAVEVSDWGEPMLVDDGITPPEPEAESGRGLFIISKLMDAFEAKRHNHRKSVSFMKKIGAEAWKA